MKPVFLSLLGVVLAPCWAQSVSVYSEFARIDATGKVTAPQEPREILSPAVVRSGFTSFQVVAEAPSEAKWWLFIGQNPENSFKVTMYKESGEALEPVDLPYQSQGTQVFWMDVWTDGDARVQRVKLEPELNINEDWVTYPIEARVVEARIPPGPPILGVLRPEPASLMRISVCGLPAGGIDFNMIYGVSGSGPSLADLRSRNSQQDTRLMDAHAAAKEDVKKLLGGCDAPLPSDPESYLPIRDYLFRLR